VEVRMNQVKPLVLTDGDGSEVRVSYDNRGEPYREGVEFSFDKCDGRTRPIWVFLERHEVESLREKLDEFLAAK